MDKEKHLYHFMHYRLAG